MTQAKTPKIRSSFHLEQEQVTELKSLASRTQKSEAWHVRQAVELWIALHAEASAEVVAEMETTFPEARTLVHRVLRALFHWKHNRDQNSIRGNQRRQDETLIRMESKIDRVLKNQEKEPGHDRPTHD